MFGRVVIACVLSACCHTVWSSPEATTFVPPPVYDCGLNQLYIACEPACGEVNITCGDLQKKPICEEKTVDHQCLPSCICKEGFYRNENYECVPEKYCYKCKNPNEVFKCGSACDSECSALGKACEIVNIVCNWKCYCKNGHARNNEGECVPYSKCPGAPTCNKNEEYSCHTICPPKTCLLIRAFYACYNAECTFRCDCKDGLLRAKNNECVTSEVCLRAPKCNTNEEYNCHYECPPKICLQIYASFMCPQDQQCLFKCDCIDGLLRNKSNDCVNTEQCLAEH